MSTIEMVKEFHEVFNHPIAKSPCIPPHKRNVNRDTWISEEIQETRDAAFDNDLIEFIDGLGDIQYFLDGWFLEAGLFHLKDAIVAEIHRSNMSKSCATADEAQRTIDSIMSKQGWLCTYEQVGDRFIVYNADGKAMKSINYFKPNLKPIIYGTSTGSGSSTQS